MIECFQFSLMPLIFLQGNFCTCMAGTYKLIWDNSYSAFFKKVERHSFGRVFCEDIFIWESFNIFLASVRFVRSSATRWTAYLQLWNQPNLQMKWKDERILISCNFLSNGWIHLYYFSFFFQWHLVRETHFSWHTDGWTKLYNRSMFVYYQTKEQSA